PRNFGRSNSQAHGTSLGRILVKCGLSRGGNATRELWAWSCTAMSRVVMPRLKDVDGRDMPGHDAFRVLGKENGGSQPLEQILRTGNVGLAGRVLEVERLHHAVLDHH